MTSACRSLLFSNCFMSPIGTPLITSLHLRCCLFLTTQCAYMHEANSHVLLSTVKSRDMLKQKVFYAFVSLFVLNMFSVSQSKYTLCLSLAVTCSKFSVEPVTLLTGLWCARLTKCVFSLPTAAYSVQNQRSAWQYVYVACCNALPSQSHLGVKHHC